MPRPVIDFDYTSGLDEARQGQSTDPFGRNFPTNFGLRVPPVLASREVTLQPRYLFLLSTRVIERETTIIRGVRTGATIGCKLNGIPREQIVTSPTFDFSDGNISYHLVREPNDLSTYTQVALSDAPSWSFMYADQPAMLYQDATFTAGNANADGRPFFYPVGLNTYTPPDITQRARPLGGNLGNQKGIVFPWSPVGDNRLLLRVPGNCRISLYASVLQTNPSTRTDPGFPDVAATYPGALTPEDAFYATFKTSAIYWRVFGSLIFDDVTSTT